MKTTMPRLLLSLLLSVLLLAAAPVLCAQQLRSGDLVLHYSVIPTLQLQPDVARQYGLTRSSSRALLNVAVRRHAADGSDHGQAARVTASATNSVGQRQDLRLREVREGEAIYYLSDLRAEDGETYRFEVRADVDGAPRPLVATFSQQYFAPR